MSTIKDMIDTIRITPVAKRYQKFYSTPWASEREAELRHVDLCTKFATWLNNNAYTNGSDDTEIRFDSILVKSLKRILFFLRSDLPSLR